MPQDERFEVDRVVYDDASFHPTSLPPGALVVGQLAHRLVCIDVVERSATNTRRSGSAAYT
jgi:hypothetical protein